jgi:hypothetical protein
MSSLCSLFSFYKLRSMPFFLRRFYTCRNSNKNGIVRQTCLSKKHFFGKKGYKKVLCVIFVGFKMVFSNTITKIPSKRTKNVIHKIYLYRQNRCFTFSRYFTDFAHSRGHPPEHLNFQPTDLRKFKPIHVKTITKKRNCNI